MKETSSKKVISWAVLLTAFAILYFICSAICYSGSTQAQFAQSNDGFWKTSWGVFALFLYGISLLWVAYCVWTNKYLFVPDHRDKADVVPFYWIAIAAFCIRVILALAVLGYESDIACFKSWGYRLTVTGCSGFYSDAYFCDYPPGYLYILALCRKVCEALLIQDNVTLSALVYKMPAMLCDLGIASLFYHRIKDRYGHLNGMLAGSLILFCPNIFADSAMWGQVDSVWMLPMIACLFALEDEKILPACLWFTISLLIKPQALMFAPMLLVFAIFFVVKEKGRGFLRGAVAMGAAVLLFILVTFPFAKDLGYSVIWDKYFGTMTSYPYITLNAPNFYYFFNLNANDLSREFFGLSFHVWTTLGIVFSALLAAFVYYKNRHNHPLVLSCVVLLYGVFLFGPAMHERYLYPAALACTYLAWQKKDKVYNLIACSASIVSFFSMTCVLRVMHFPSGYPAGLFACALNLVTFGALVYNACRKSEAAEPLRFSNESKFTKLASYIFEVSHRQLNEKREPRKLCWNKYDTIFVLLLTLAYALVGFSNLGDREWPQTYWEPQTVGESYVIDLGSEQSIAHINILEGIGDGALQFSYSNDGEDWEAIDMPWQTSYVNFLSWVRIDYEFSARYVCLNVTQPGLRIHEIGFFDENDAQLTIASVETTATDAMPFTNAVDEQHLVPAAWSYENGTYFDEVYHARTAIEQLEGWAIYEQTHPPLGKILIGWGIQLFGLSPFGWRFMGTLAGVLMLPALYVFGKYLFKKTRWAVMLCALMGLDFMHYAQTRIATIDSFSVLFIILMYLFMYIWLQQDYYGENRIFSYTMLGLSGIFFGIGAATKWICIYAGAGLAVLFFIRLAKEFLTFRHAGRMLEYYGEEDFSCRDRCELIRAKFTKKTIALIGFCLVFFVLIPCVIYVLSYIPYIGTPGQPEGLLSIVWENQKYIFKYHSDYVLDQLEVHPYQSAWYTWPFIGRPIFYYMGMYLEEGMVSGISSFGNPAIWWFGIFAFGWFCLTLYLKDSHARDLKEPSTDSSRIFVLIAMLAQFLPWVLVTRSTYIYHYFATTPFLMMCIVYFFRDMEAMHENKRILRIIPWAYLALCLVLFVMFYPLLTGIPIQKEYAEFCRWLPGWVLYGYWI